MSEHNLHRDGDPLDGLVRRSLENLRAEPSPGVWRRISRRLLRSELLRFRLKNLPGAFWPVAIPASMILVGIALYMGIGDEQTPPVTVTSPVAEQPHKPPQPPAPQTLTGQPVPPASQATRPPVASPGTPSSGDQTAGTLPHATHPDRQTTSSQEQPEASREIPTSATSQPALILTLTAIPAGGIDTEPTPRPVMTQRFNPAPKEVSEEPLPHIRSRSVEMGINITPDLVFYRNAGGSFKYNYTFDLGARYSFGRFYLQSGAGVTYSTDIGDYAISYLHNDSVGFYYTIESFYVEPGAPPEFTIKQVTVYDSVQYLYDYSTKNRYYYLQIPFSAGYRMVDKPAWRLSVEAGLVYAYLFSVTEPAPTFHVPEGRILDIERKSPERNRHSFGITGGVTLEYQFARNFFLLIEPTCKYYLQAVEENSSRGDKQPYSVGLRAGIWYRLHAKNRTK